MKEIWEEVREQHLQAEEEQLKEEPAGEEARLKPGEEVLVDWSSLQGMEGVPKLQDRWGGPYLIQEEVALGAFRLKGLAKGILDVWNQDRVKCYIRRPKWKRMMCQAPAASRLKVDDQGRVSREVEAIIGHRRGKLRGQWEYLVQWKGVPEASWEKAAAVKGCEDLVQQYLHTPASVLGLTSVTDEAVDQQPVEGSGGQVTVKGSRRGSCHN